MAVTDTEVTVVFNSVDDNANVGFYRVELLEGDTIIQSELIPHVDNTNTQTHTFRNLRADTLFTSVISVVGEDNQEYLLSALTVATDGEAFWAGNCVMLCIILKVYVRRLRLKSHCFFTLSESRRTNIFCNK